MNRPPMVLPGSQGSGGAGGLSRQESSFEPQLWQNVASGSLFAEPQLGQASSKRLDSSSIKTVL